MKVLGIRQPWASLIISGIKDVEIRTRRTLIDEYVAIYATRTKPKKEDMEWLREMKISDSEYYPKHLMQFPMGQIIGTAYLFDCEKYHSCEKFKSDVPFHRNNPKRYREGLYGWQIANPRAIHPIDFKFKGSIVWGSIADDVIELNINDDWEELIQ